MKFLVRPQLRWVYSDGEIVVLHRKYTTIIILLEQLRTYSIQYSSWNDFTHKNICSAEAGLHCFGENSAEVRSTVSTGAPSHSVPLILRTKIRWRGPTSKSIDSNEEQRDESYPIIAPIRPGRTPLPWRQLLLVFGLRAVKPLMFELIFPFVSEWIRWDGSWI